MNDAAAIGTIRRLPTGSEPGPDGTHFRVWAPRHDRMRVVLESETGTAPDGDAKARVEHELIRDEDGHFIGLFADATAGTRYWFRPGDGDAVPDPASRYQPDGPHGPSMVIDPAAFRWTDAGWTGPDAGRHVIYEMHVGTFTTDGTWVAAIERLPDLADLGITIIELMPVAEFAGRFNWGYDGVAPFAPSHVYGTPDDMRRFIDRAHALGMAVVIDVVYNHMGPDGCYMTTFAEEYFSRAHRTEWGPAVNFDGDGSANVRAFFLANAEYWITEFHLDGLRIDATHNMYDSGPRHILADLTERARTAANGRRIWIVAENESQDVRLLHDTANGGYGMDAVWNDDFHHTAIVALAGMAEAYYTDYRGTPQELISCARHGFLYQGQHYAWQNRRRGTPTDGIARNRFVHFIQNHDQIANSLAGRRLHEVSGAAEMRAMTALLLLMPGTAMLFQGQEFAASAPFLYFADHEPELAARVSAGRREFLGQFRSMRTPEAQASIPEPAALETFTRCRIDHGEREANATILQLHRDLIRLSRTDPVFAAADCDVDGAVLGPHALALRYRNDDGDDRLIIVNLGADLPLHVVPEPLLAPPLDRQWKLMLSTEDPRYDGRGAAHPELANGWLIQGRSAAVLVPAPLADDGSR